MGRILIDIEKLVASQRGELLDAIFALTDDINNALKNYVVTFIHHDTDNFLAFDDLEEGS